MIDGLERWRPGSPTHPRPPTTWPPRHPLLQKVTLPPSLSGKRGNRIWLAGCQLEQDGTTRPVFSVARGIRLKTRSTSIHPSPHPPHYLPPPQPWRIAKKINKKEPYLFWQIPIKCFSETPLSAVTVTLPRGRETHFKCMGVRGNDEASRLSDETYPLSCDDGGILSPKNGATAHESKFILTINVRCLWLREERKDEDGRRERMARKERWRPSRTGRPGRVGIGGGGGVTSRGLF